MFLFAFSVLLTTSLTTVYAAPSAQVICADGNKASNAACCAFFSLRDNLQQNLFNNQCGIEAHQAIHLSFVDALGFSRSGKFQGTGADGSILLFGSIEANFASNVGTDDGIDSLLPFLELNPNITAGDLVQFAAAVGLSNCPGAPKLQFLAGRPNAKVPASDGTVPLASATPDEVFARAADVGLTPTDWANLLASHSVNKISHVDPVLIDAPLDTTPFTFDTQFFLEILLKGTSPPANNDEASSALRDEGVIRLKSDFLVSQDPRTSCTMQNFVNKQQMMMAAFKASMQKLAVIGNNPSTLVDCTDALPNPVPPVNKPATFPATKTAADLQLACDSPFPSLATDPGPVTQVPNDPPS